MAIWPFNRKKAEEVYEEPQELPIEQPTSNLPEEVQEYYETGNRERVGVAWLLGLGTLVVTLLLAFGLFFGGRWVYRKATSKDTASTSSQIGEDNKSKDSGSNQNKQEANSGSGTSSTNTNQSNPTPAPTTPTPAPATPSPQPSTPAPSTTTPSQTTPAPTAGAVPNTGPGNVFAIAAIAAAAATIGYYAVQLRKES